MKSSVLTAAVVAASLSAAPAMSASFDLSYIFGANLLTATIEGTLQPDGNTVLVTGVPASAFNGAPQGALPFLNSVTNFLSASGAPASLSLDGTTADFIACFDVGCSDGFAVELSGAAFGGPVFSAGVSFGTIAFEAFDINGYSLTAQSSAVPLPAPLALLLAGMAGLGLVARRRAA